MAFFLDVFGIFSHFFLQQFPIFSISESPPPTKQQITRNPNFGATHKTENHLKPQFWGKPPKNFPALAPIFFRRGRFWGGGGPRPPPPPLLSVLRAAANFGESCLWVPKEFSLCSAWWGDPSPPWMERAPHQALLQCTAPGVLPSPVY